MSKAGFTRFSIGIVGGGLALTALLMLKPLWLGLVVFAGAMMVSSVAASAAFARLATQEEIRSDLEDRVRNPPA